ncbi:major facilitator superfamily domain-containing protein 1 isoform X2 [Folsomia candida]|uniref:major facilitator superfamily domain-containing protein 1 isoform X2 n=1 Tax=Folsomia candida TaxID=158441 RepID=UPI000B8FD95F|nr:major facilitator superfamily domain-containing protein 1 isoform X2 [Folsomia candida]
MARILDDGGDTDVLTGGGSTDTRDYGESSVETRSGGQGGCWFSCCDPRSSLHRFIVLLFMCFLGFGSYFCYDNPGALQDNFMKDMDITTAQFTYLYSFYSWPNVVLCFVGGFLLDSVFGIRLGTVIFCIFLVIGQIVFALGGIFDMFWLMLLGRFIFGIGGESLAVAQNAYAVSWFKGKELNMVFGLQLSFARVGSTVNFNLMEPLYKWMNTSYKGHTCTGIVLMIAGATCILSLFCAAALAIFDFRAEKILKKQTLGSGEKIRLSDVRYFPVSFWLMCGSCVAYYVAIFPFIGLGKVFFIRKFDFTPEGANAVNSILYIVSAVASPLFGLLVDRTGRNVFYVFISILVTIGAHGILAFTFLNPYVGMCIMGLSYSMLASALWPMVALVIPEHQLGTAYGIMQAVQNFGLAVITSVAGEIVDTGGYLLLEVFFIAWLCLSLACTVLLWLHDSSHSAGLLNMSIDDRDRWEHDKIYLPLTTLPSDDYFTDL